MLRGAALPRRVLLRSAASERPALRQTRRFVQQRTPVATAAQARALELFEKRQKANYSGDASSGKAVNYWRSAALATSACGALVFLDEHEPAACAGMSGKDGDDVVEQAKKKLKELTDSTVAQLAALLPEDYSNLQKQVDDFLASGKGGQISWGFAMGACSGFALKKVSKLGALAVGALFVLLQCASYSGYIDVDYKKMERDIKGYLDINEDGVFDTKDLNQMYKNIMKVLEFSLPAGSGFAAGFVLGFRSG